MSNIQQLAELVQKLRDEYTKSATQIMDVHRMMSDMSVKIDILAASLDAAAITSNAKPAAKTVKKSGKATAGTATTVDAKAVDAKADGTATTADSTTSAATSDAKAAGTATTADTKKPTKRRIKTTIEEPTTADAKAVDATGTATTTDAAGTATTETKKPTKRKIKTTDESNEAVPAESSKSVNKLHFFKKEFEKDETRFDKFFTPEVKKVLEEGLKNKTDLSADQFKKERQQVYYHYIKDNHADELDAMKNGK